MGVTRIVLNLVRLIIMTIASFLVIGQYRNIRKKPLKNGLRQTRWVIFLLTISILVDTTWAFTTSILMGRTVFGIESFSHSDTTVLLLILRFFTLYVVYRFYKLFKTK